MLKSCTEVLRWFAGTLAIFLLVLNPLICELDHCCDSCNPCCGTDDSPVCQCPCGLISVQCEPIDLGTRIPSVETPFSLYAITVPEGFHSDIERPPRTA